MLSMNARHQNPFLIPFLRPLAVVERKDKEGIEVRNAPKNGFWSLRQFYSLFLLGKRAEDFCCFHRNSFGDTSKASQRKPNSHRAGHWLVNNWGLATLKPFSESAAADNLGRQGFQHYSPQYMERRIVRGRKTFVPAPLFPGYIFICLSECWKAISNTKGVASLLMEGDGEERRPIPVRPRVIENIKSQEVNGFVVLPDQRSIFEKFHRGDSLEVQSGPLQGHVGIYSGDRKSDRLKVLFKMLGRDTAVYLRESDLTFA